jgi:hypothetical protein
MSSNPHLIKEPPKLVHLIPPFQNKQMLKDLIQLAKFRYGRGVIVPLLGEPIPQVGDVPKENPF